MEGIKTVATKDFSISRNEERTVRSATGERMGRVFPVSRTDWLAISATGTEIGVTRYQRDAARMVYEHRLEAP